MTDELSEKAVNDILTRLNGALQNQGFTTSWSRPFWKWVRGGSDGVEPDGNELHKEFYVADLPISRVAPFDFTEIKVAHFLGRIRFSLTVYFRDVLERALTAKDFEEVYAEHDRSWIARLDEHFSDVAGKYSLQWDIEVDDMIEDSLYGDFQPTDAPDRIVALLKDIRGLGSNI